MDTRDLEKSLASRQNWINSRLYLDCDPQRDNWKRLELLEVKVDFLIDLLMKISGRLGN
jgi:hypothetical protein